jgi:uncharacterized damage-inducible protein DinB
VKQVISSYIRLLNKVTHGDNWLDETFDKKLNGITDEEAFKRPIKDLHSVAELVSHLLEWRLSVLNILKGGARTLSMESPANWRTNDELRQSGWPALKKRFYDSQEQLIKLLEQKDDAYLQQKSPKSEDLYEEYISGMVEHDLYHLGQLGIVIKFLKG